MTPRSIPRTRAGQATVEFVVALVVVLVLVAGLLLVGQLALAHTRTLTAARREAGYLAMQTKQALSSADYILRRTPGPDGVRYSRDDDFDVAQPINLQTRVVAYAHPAPLQGLIRGNRVSALAQDPEPALSFGLIRAEAHETVANIPVARRLLYGADRIDVQATVFATSTTGIY